MNLSQPPLRITESGSPGAYRVYDGQGVTIDVKHQHDSCIVIDASHVIIRGFTLRGAGDRNNSSSKPIGAVLVEGGHDIIIERERDDRIVRIDDHGEVVRDRLAVLA